LINISNNKIKQLTQNKMNTFTITFKNANHNWESVTLKLKMHSVNQVKQWWDEHNSSARSIEKH